MTCRRNKQCGDAGATLMQLPSYRKPTLMQVPKLTDATLFVLFMDLDVSKRRLVGIGSDKGGIRVRGLGRICKNKNKKNIYWKFIAVVLESRGHPVIQW